MVIDNTRITDRYRHEWRDPTRRRPEWVKRIEHLLPLFPSPLVSVADLGCYDMELGNYTGSAVYTPVDIIDRKHPRFVRADLNYLLPDIEYHQVIACFGLLEYLDNVPRMVEWMSRRCATIICSYAFRAPWAYHANEQAFADIFYENGFKMVDRITNNPNAYVGFRFDLG